MLFNAVLVIIGLSLLLLAHRTGKMLVRNVGIVLILVGLVAGVLEVLE